MIFSLLKSPVKASPATETHSSFEFDAHILIYNGEELSGHEYMLNAKPEVFTERMATLEAQSQVSVIYETTGTLTAIAQHLPMVNGNPAIRVETLQEWQQRDPQEVAQVTGQYIEETDEGDLALWRI
ncbi:MAG: hypothetical protein WA902_09910 [Thermosynechococcaceae cyanobacterium]